MSSQIDLPDSPAREALHAAQCALVEALLQNRELPHGFDPQRIAATAEALHRKRERAVAKCWPTLKHALGAEFAPRFGQYAQASTIPKNRGALADGYRFACWLQANEPLPDDARLQIMAVALRYRHHTMGLLPRSGPALRATWLHDARQCVLGLRLRHFCTLYARFPPRRNR